MVMMCTRLRSILIASLALTGACVIDAQPTRSNLFLCNTDQDCIEGYYCEESLEAEEEGAVGLCVQESVDPSDESDASEAADPSDVTEASEPATSDDPSEGSDTSDPSDDSEPFDPDCPDGTITLTTSLPTDATIQDITLRLDCWDASTGTPESGAFTDRNNNYEWRELTDFRMEGVDSNYPWADFKLVTSLEGIDDKYIFFFTEPTASTGQLQMLVFSDDFGTLFFDSDRRDWGVGTDGSCNDPLALNYSFPQGGNCVYSENLLNDYNGGFEAYCGDDQDRIWEWLAEPSDGAPTARSARANDPFEAWPGAPQPSNSDRFQPLDGEGAGKVSTDRQLTSGTSGLVLTETLPDDAADHFVFEAFIYVSRFEPFSSPDVSGEVFLTFFDESENELGRALFEVDSALEKDTWHQIKLCAAKPPSGHELQVGFEISHENSGAGALFFDNAALRAVATCPGEEFLDNADFSVFPQSSFSDTGYIQSAFREGECIESGDTTACSTPSGVLNCDGADRVGPYHSEAICAGPFEELGGLFECDFICPEGFERPEFPISNTCVPSGAETGMARIPGSTYSRGCSSTENPSCTIEAQPQFSVTVSSFDIDITEVTAGGYRECVTSGVCSAPALSGVELQLSTYTLGNDDAAMNFVTFDQATDYCRFRSKRLPTEAEWEIAAGGVKTGLQTSKNKFPWGSVPGPDCNHVVKGSCGFSMPTTVGTLARGHSFFGLANMGGNVREWIQDFYSTTLYSDSGERIRYGGPSENLEETQTVRGSSFDRSDNVQVHTWYRSGILSEFREVDLGFRCARLVDKLPLSSPCLADIDCLSGTCAGPFSEEVCQ